MNKKKLFFKLLLFLFILSFNLSFLVQLSLAKADMVIVQEDGAVVLVTSEGVLAAATDSKKNQSSQKPPVNPPSPPAPTKTVPLAPSNVSTIIQANPSKQNNKKITVSIQSAPLTNSSRSQSNSPTKNTSGPVSSPISQTPTTSQNPNLLNFSNPPRPLNLPTVVPTPTNGTLPNNLLVASSAPTSEQPPTTNREVDQVILEGKSNETVLSIQPSQQPNQITFSQGGTQVETALSLQINNQTHSISSVSQSGITTINVLPKEAVDGVIEEGLIKPNTDPNADTRVSLIEEDNSTFYKIQGEKDGKLFGLISVKSPVEVKLSAETGKVVNVTHSSPLFNLMGAFIK